MSTVRITNVSGGTCVSSTTNLVNAQVRGVSKAQQWIIEKGPNESSFAFRNVQNGLYLRANNGAAKGAIGTGSIQFWTLTPGVAAESCFFKSHDFPNAYLANAGGHANNGNQVYCWPLQDVWTHALTWYLHDINVEGFTPAGKSGLGAKVIVEQEAKMSVMQAELQKTVDASAEKTKELQLREENLVKRELEVAVERERAQGDTAATANELAAKEATLTSKESESSKHERVVEEGGNTVGTGAVPPPSTAHNDTDLQAENARLRAEINRLKDASPFQLSKRSQGGGMRAIRSPAFNTKSNFDPVLLKRFEEGKKVVRTALG